MPPALAGARNIAFFAGSSDGKTAFIDESLQQLWFSDGPNSDPKLVVQLPAEFGFQGALEMSDTGIIYASQGHGSFFINVSTGSAVEITGSQYFFLKGNHVVTMDASTEKSNFGHPPIRVFDLAAGDLPTCPKTPAPLHNLLTSTASTQPSVGAGA